MKTSNKILLAFLLLIFITPLLLAVSLKNKIKNKEYVQQRSDGSNIEDGNYHGSFGTYKVLKLVSPVKGVFTCRLHPSKTASYSYQNYYPGARRKDSVHIYNHSDTLFMEYIPYPDSIIQGGSNNESPFYFNIELNADLPSFEKLEIQGATAIIDSLPDSLPSMKITLSDSAQLKMGEGGSKEESVIPPARTLARISCRVTDLTIKATGSELSFGPYFIADHLRLDISGASTLSVKDAVIKKVDGRLSDSSTVNASGKYFRQLAALTGK
jgi:hypothetical protein